MLFWFLSSLPYCVSFPRFCTKIECWLFWKHLLALKERKKKGNNNKKKGIKKKTKKYKKKSLSTQKRDGIAVYVPNFIFVF